MATAKKDPAAEVVDPPEPDPQPDGAVDESRVREIVDEALARITGSGEPDPEKPAGRQTQAAVEDDVESKVRAAIDKLRTDEDRDTRLAALEEKVATPERPPVKERVSTRLMGWGRKAAR